MKVFLPSVLLLCGQFPLPVFIPRISRLERPEWPDRPLLAIEKWQRILEFGRVMFIHTWGEVPSPFIIPCQSVSGCSVWWKLELIDSITNALHFLGGKLFKEKSQTIFSHCHLVNWPTSITLEKVRWFFGSSSDRAVSSTTGKTRDNNTIERSKCRRVGITLENMLKRPSICDIRTIWERCQPGVITLHQGGRILVEIMICYNALCVKVNSKWGLCEIMAIVRAFPHFSRPPLGTITNQQISSYCLLLGDPTADIICGWSLREGSI